MCATPNERTPPSSYDVRWDSPSLDPLDSMPLSGMRGAGANVWVQDGSLWIYLAHNGAYDERGRLLKLGCLRLTPSGGISTVGFLQHLDLATGSISITGSTAAGARVAVCLWFSGEDLIIESLREEGAPWEVCFGTWRDVPRTDVHLDMWSKQETTADEIQAGPTYVTWFHRNRDHASLLPERASVQGLQPSDALDRTTHRIFGGALVSNRELRIGKTEEVQWLHWPGGRSWSYTLETEGQFSMAVALRAGEGLSPETWASEARQILVPSRLEAARCAARARWDEFWGRSWIHINAARSYSDPGWQVGRNQALFRFMLACNQGGELPLLFNGGIFTVDNSPGRIRGNNNAELPIGAGSPSSPDFRRWMFCGFMSQNQRWLGWPTLASGDRDLLAPSLTFYRDRSGVAAARARKNGADGVAYTEPLDIWGLCATGDRPDALCGHPHLTYHFAMMLEHAWMALEAHSTNGIELKDDLGWMIGTLRFYDSFYRSTTRASGKPELDEKGRLVLYPASSVEAVIGATNPVDAVAGLHAVTDGLLRLPPGRLSEDKRSWLQAFRSTLPTIPVGEREGRKSVLIAESYEKTFNAWEFPEMYAAWPYKRIGVTVPDTLQLARATLETIQDPWASKVRNHDFSWMPNIANAASCGLSTNARDLLVAKLSDEKAQVRFPAFFGPGHDWLPDHNWGGSAMLGLQCMLLQASDDGKRLHLLPAWPLEWDVDFRLHTAACTTVECSLRNGRIDRLEVTPSHRKEALILPTSL